MIFITISILLSSFLTIAFKLCDRLGINKFQAIVYNYFFCAVTGCFAVAAWPSYYSNAAEPWFKWALFMGTGFIITFYLIALTVQKSGLAVAAVTSKLSLIIPFLFSLYLYNETASFLRIAGILLALLAVVLTLKPAKPATNDNSSTYKTYPILKTILPVAVFVGTGLLDALIKYVEQKYITESIKDIYLITAFSTAFAAGFFLLFTGMALKKITFQSKAILAGFIIGVPNYFSIWFLIKGLKQYNKISSVILPVNNMGIVLVSALVAWLFFKEKLTAVNWAGIVLSVLSIMMIAFAK